MSVCGGYLSACICTCTTEQCCSMEFEEKKSMTRLAGEATKDHCEVSRDHCAVLHAHTCMYIST